MYREHNVFRMQKTRDLPLWRYMDFWKFLKLINTKKLFFPNVEMLGDQHEGRIPKKILEMMEKDKNLNETFHKVYPAFIEKELRPKTVVCSWIASQHESFAMWKMYAKEKLGVAIKSNYERLKNSFHSAKEDVYIGEVTYYDDEHPFFVVGNSFHVFLTKHKYYEYESEVRCIAQIGDDELGITTKNIDVDLDNLIEEIYISPFAFDTGLAELIEFLKSGHSLNFKIEVSGVNDMWI